MNHPNNGDSWQAFRRARRTILVVDMVESVRLMEAYEDDTIRWWQSFLAEATGQCLPACGGRLVKSLGDGLMAEFAQSAPAVACALRLQALARALSAPLDDERRVHLRIGAHVADVIVDAHDLYGAGVNLAARLTTLAGPAEVVVSAEVRDQLVPGLDADLEDLGECRLRHLEQPVRAWRVGPPGPRPVVAAGSSAFRDPRPALAVIPLQPRGAAAGASGAPAADDALGGVLGEVLADELIAALSHATQWHVISRLSTSALARRGESLTAIGELLGAQYVLSGSYHVQGDQLRTQVELADVRSQRVLWADAVSARVGAVLAGEDPWVHTVVGRTSTAILSEQAGQARTRPLPTLDSYTLLLGAITLMHRTAPEDFARAHELLQHLVERGRAHPVPYAWLAKWHVLKVQQGWSQDLQGDTQAALAQAQRALERDPACALAWTVDGFVHANLLRDLDGAGQRYAQALQANPHESLAWLLSGTLHAFRDEGPQALQASERALVLSPLDPLRYFYDSLAATAAVAAGQHERAIVLAQRSLRLNRTHTSTYRALAIAQVLSGQGAQARQTMAELLRLQPGFTVSGFLARTPGSAQGIGLRMAQALREAGAPQ